MPATHPRTSAAAKAGSKDLASSRRVSVVRIRVILTHLGMPSAKGIDLPAIFAAVAMAESAGDPSAVNPDDAGTGWPSIGLWQVFERDHQPVVAELREIIALGLSPEESARRQAIVIATLFRDATRTALQAAETLRHRGFTVTAETVAALVDAAWQHAPLTVLRWAADTTRAELREINARIDRFLTWYRRLVARAAAGAILGGLVFLGVVAWGLTQWNAWERRRR